MSLVLGLLLNTLIIAGLIVWLSKGDGAKWINTLNSTALASFVVLLIVLETAGAVNGMFVWAVLNGKVEMLSGALGYLGLWFGFLGTHVFAISATLIGKRVTDEKYVQKKGEAKAAVEAAKMPAPTNGTPSPETTERPAMPGPMRPSQQVNVIVDGEPTP